MKNSCIDFYDALSKYYDEVFPLPEAKREFPIKHLKENSNILDIGCSTGDLTYYLYSKGYNAWGIDLDSKMIELCKEKYGEEKKLHFQVMDMKRIKDKFSEYFSGLICIGNVLPHLDGKEEIKEFLIACREVMKTDGYIYIQIINFTKIRRENIRMLPILKGKDVIFKRFYDFDKEDKYVNFKGQLILNDGEILENNVKLYMIDAEEIVSILRELGFTEVKLYDDFKRSEYTGTSINLIVEAKK